MHFHQPSRPIQQRMYHDLAWVYDLIYASKDYRRETRKLVELIRCFKKTPGKECLEVACGTGNYLQHLSKHFACTGVDKSPAMLAIARKKLPKRVRLQQADMTTLALGRQFDILLCLFSSIGYARTLPTLRRIFRRFALHVKPGGVAVIDPWFTRSQFLPSSARMETYDAPTIKIARQCVPRIAGSQSVLDMHFLIAKEGDRVRHYLDRHVLGLWSIAQMKHTFIDAGFRVHYFPNALKRARGRLLGVRV